jgi:hypothetical protein
MDRATNKFTSSLALLGAICLLPGTAGADSPATAPASPGWQKPIWLTDLSFGARESYDNNVLLVSGEGMKPQSSWISSASPKVGFNFAPLFAGQTSLQTLSLVYAPDFFIYHEAPSETYNAQKLINTIKLKTGNFTFGLDNAFSYIDGNREAETYALNQTANQDDKYRNFFAQAVPRERRNQIQDRNTTLLQYDWDHFFVRPTASLIYYGLNTDWHNTSVAPYKGYQNYPDRYDVNGGTDFGCKVMPDLALTLGYRYGHQYQEQFTPAITSDSHFSSSDYQRILVGVEGKPWNWLTVKAVGGPDFRDYNPDAAIGDKNLVTYYGEASVTAAVGENQSVAVNYKQWQWVSSAGLVPFFDSSYVLNYHWQASKPLGFDFGGKILEADFTSGDDYAGTAPSHRDDRQYTVNAGITYAFNRHLSASLTGSYDIGASNIKLPANLQPGYRDFQHDLVSLGLQYKF